MATIPRLAGFLVATLVAAALVLPGKGTGADRSGAILVVGDSLGVGMEPYLAEELGGAAVTTDARTSRTSAAGLDVLGAALGPEHSVVVFALGTNDDPASPQTLAQNLGAAATLSDGRCMVVATVSRPPLNGVPADGLNDAIRDFAAAAPNVSLVDWEGAVAADPGLLEDGVHATPAGYELRARLFADAIEQCGGVISAGSGSAAGAGGGPDGGDGIPNPDLDELAEGRTRPAGDERAERPEPISREVAYAILADAISSQIALGALR